MEITPAKNHNEDGLHLCGQRTVTAPKLINLQGMSFPSPNHLLVFMGVAIQHERRDFQSESVFHKIVNPVSSLTVMFPVLK
jgi:hypothetical protein